ncbi:MAG: SMC-Scp complex subunit ScpB [Bacteroidia bacterium]|nr:SMC-Scp complex subunit ScpB [Bacteroidia bacterium]MCX7652154.1 SMC-Scp complex subunit ScpB [Bacteroidia bacterium]MDW8416897.1 SMC-Scp complex subunit ScpB [Bacteroidia bacterium]
MESNEVQTGYPLENLIEAILFTNSNPVSISALQKAVEYITGTSYVQKDIEHALEILRQRYSISSIEIIEVAGGYALRTRPGYGEALAKYIGLQNPLHLSKPLLETLAIIAYHQPVTRPFINHLRGVQSDYAVDRLLELELIEPAGRANLPGKPLSYRTSAKFLELLGLRSLEDLPKLRELSDTPSPPDPSQIHPAENQSA